MDFNFLEYFYTDKYDDKIILKNSAKSFSVSEIKDFVSCEVQYLKTISDENIQINTENPFDFIIILIACIFANKHIWITNNNNQDKIPRNVLAINEITENKSQKLDFLKVENDKIHLTFFTSGSTSEPKLVEKTLKGLLEESNDVISSFDLLDKKYEFITSAPINHLFAITFYIFTALNSKNIIHLEKINYPENLNVDNSVLITTPSFMSYMHKHNIKPIQNPKYTISAGAVLKSQTHKFFEEFSNVINIYGSTESGIIAHKSKPNGNFQLFNGIKILSSDEDGTNLLSNYSSPKEVFINDKILVKPNNVIEVCGRNDRIFKIQEKRISAEELEEEINKNDFVNNCHIVNLGNKIGALIALNSAGSEYFLQNGNVKITKLLKSKLNEKFAIIPQKWKYIDVIPQNKMGKINSPKVKELFDVNLSLPYILNRKIEENYAEFELFFYKNCNFFKGHFEEFPIVPGVVQLYYASFFANLAFSKTCHIGQIRRIKFSSIIHPDTTVKLKLTLSDKSVNYEYDDEKTSYSSASLPLSNHLEEQ